MLQRHRMPEKPRESGLAEQFDSLDWHFLLTECVEKDTQSHVLERCFFRLENPVPVNDYYCCFMVASSSHPTESRAQQRNTHDRYFIQARVLVLAGSRVVPCLWTRCAFSSRKKHVNCSTRFGIWRRILLLVRMSKEWLHYHHSYLSLFLLRALGGRGQTFFSELKSGKMFTVPAALCDAR